MRLGDIIRSYFAAGSPPMDDYEVPFSDQPTEPLPRQAAPPTIATNAAPAVLYSSGGTASFTPGPSPREQQLEAELAQQRQAVEQLRLRQIESDAEAFWQAQFAAAKVVPAEKQALVADFVQRAQDDAKLGLVTFADGSQASRVAQLHAVFAARPAQPWTRELVGATAQVLPVQYGNPNVAAVQVSQEQIDKAIEHDVTAGVERFLRQAGTQAERDRHAQRYGQGR